MAPVIKYQNIDSATYNWLSSTGACKEINDELRTWITAINGNASQTGRQVVMHQDETTSTSANYFGFTVELPNGGGDSIYMGRFTSSTGIMRSYISDTWTAGTTNGSYGSFSGFQASLTSISWRTSGVGVTLMTAYDTTDGAEWFMGSVEADSVSYSHPFLIAKVVGGGWGASSAQASNWRGLFHDGVGYQSAYAANFFSNTTAVPRPGYLFQRNGSVDVNATASAGAAYANTDQLYFGRYSSMGDWQTIGTNNYILYAGGQAGLWVNYNGN